MPVVTSVVTEFWQATDGSWVESKESSISWHYEGAEQQFGREQATELMKRLELLLRGQRIDIVQLTNSKIIEIKPKGISKGK